MWVVGEIRAQQAELGQLLERVDESLVPVVRCVDHVVVELDEVVGRRVAERHGRRRSADVRLVVDDADPRVGQRVEIRAGAVRGAVVPDHDLLGQRRGAADDVLDALPEQVHSVVRENDNRNAHSDS